MSQYNVGDYSVNTLLCGNIGYWNTETLKYAFPEDSLVLCGTDCEEKKDQNIKWFQLEVKSQRFKTVFHTYDFERVIYMSEYLTYHTSAENELENIRNLLRNCRKSAISQLIYFTSDVVCSIEENSKRMILEAAERLFHYYAKQCKVDLRIIRSPFLLSPVKKNDYLYGLFHTVYMKKDQIRMDAPEEEHDHFMDMRDIAEFFYRLSNNWEAGECVLRLFPVAKCTFRDLGEFLKSIDPGLTVQYADHSASRPFFRKGENTVRTAFGWSPMYDPLESLPAYYKEYLELNEKKPGLRERIRRFIHLRSSTVMVIELLLTALFVEYMNHVSGNSVQFRMIDYRLLYVVIFASVYGTNAGFLASIIESFSLALAYYQRGSNWLMIFYDPGNWLPFIFLYVVAAVCGYVKQKNDENFHFIHEENNSLKERLHFITSLYEEALDYKNQYRKDLIGSRDGFGRIFEVVQRLSNTVPEKIFAESIPVMEDVLENNSIAIYTINDVSAKYARLEICSNGISSELKKSLHLSGYEKILETVKSGRVWFNRNLQSDFPMYVAGILAEGKLSVLIMIYHAEYGQTNNYYANLIRILSGLMENFIVKAWEYRHAIEERIYISGTNIAKWDYFTEQLKIESDAAAHHLTSFRLFQIDPEGKSVTDLDILFKNKTRVHDLIGYGPDGFLYMLAAQVDENSEQIVLDRILAMGLSCRIISADALPHTDILQK